MRSMPSVFSFLRTGIINAAYFLDGVVAIFSVIGYDADDDLRVRRERALNGARVRVHSVIIEHAPVQMTNIKLSTARIQCTPLNRTIRLLEPSALEQICITLFLIKILRLIEHISA